MSPDEFRELVSGAMGAVLDLDVSDEDVEEILAQVAQADVPEEERDMAMGALGRSMEIRSPGHQPGEPT